jgi:hypothetical protein
VSGAFLLVERPYSWSAVGRFGMRLIGALGHSLQPDRRQARMNKTPLLINLEADESLGTVSEKTLQTAFEISGSSTWWERACGASSGERLTSDIESLHGPPIIVPLSFGWARTLIGEASRGDLTAALIRYRAAAMRVGRQIKINHVEGESTSARRHVRDCKCWRA